MRRMMRRLSNALHDPKRVIFYFENKGFFNCLSDEKYLKLFYKLRMGEKLNLDNPQTFNEKLQWLKLNDRNPKYTKLVDKYEAKKIIADKIGKEYVIPTLGVWNSFSEINFDKLPNQFVLKCTHDSGGLVICRDKSKLDLDLAKKKINKSLKRNYFYHGREWPYKDVKPRIIAEKYMQDKDNMSLRDYKFYCFNGEVKYLYISEGLENHSTAKISFLEPDWTFAPFNRSDYLPFSELPRKPKFFENMIKISEILAQKYIFVRVDLYEINEKVYFSELTFSPCSGYMPFDPKNWDLQLGNKLNLYSKEN